jgi:hypothetical protein
VKLISPERLSVRYSNKYLALNVASLEARRLIEGMHRDEVQLAEDPYELALERTLNGEIKWAKLTEADIEALARATYEEPSMPRPFMRPQPLI